MLGTTICQAQVDLTQSYHSPLQFLLELHPMPNPITPSDIDQAVLEQPNQPAAFKPAPPKPPTPGLGKGMIAGMLIGDLSDGISTARSLNQGYREVNPFLSQNPGLNIAEQAGTGIVKALLLNKLAHSHPTLARALAFGSMGLSAGDTAWNVLPTLPPIQKKP